MPLDTTKFTDNDGEPIARRAAALPPRETEEDHADQPSLKIAATRRKAKAETVVSQPSAATKALNDTLKSASRAEEDHLRQQIADAKLALQPTAKAAKRIIEDIAEFRRLHGEWINDVAGLDLMELFLICGGPSNPAAVDRHHAINRLLSNIQLTMNNIPIQMSSAIAQIAGLRTVTKARYKSPENAVLGDIVEVRELRRLVGFAAGTRQVLDEQRVSLEIHICALATRVKEIQDAGQPRPAVASVLHRSRNRRLDVGHAVNSFDENGQPSSDWNPLDYTPGGGR
jgi:hypothetical protein